MPMSNPSGVTAPSTAPLRMITPGDSNTQGANGLYTSLGEMIAARAGGKIHYAYNAGISGETSAQIAGRVHRDIGGKRANLMVMQIGTNDSNNASIVVPTITNIVQSTLAAYPSMTIVVCSTYPNAGLESAAVANAAAIKSYVQGLNDRRVIYAPTFEALSTDGAWTTGYNVDSKHANAVGTRVAADAVLTALSSVLAPITPVVPNRYDATLPNGWLKNGTFSVGSPTSGVAAGWSLNAAAVTAGWVASIDSSDSSIVGSAQVLTAPANTATAPILSLSTSTYLWSAIAGRRLWVSFKARHTYPADATPSFQLDFLPAKATAGTRFGAGQFTNVHNSGHDGWHYFRCEYMVPVGSIDVTTLNFTLGANASTTQSLTYRIAEVDWGFCDDLQPPIPGTLNRSGYKAYAWPSLAAGAFQNTTVTVKGALVGDCARASLKTSLAGTILFAEVTAADTVTVTQWNPTASATSAFASANLFAFLDAMPI